MKKLKLLIMLAVVSFLLPVVANAEGIKNIYIFKGKTCGFCASAIEFFTDLKEDSEYKDKFNLIEYEVWYDTENKNLAEKVAEKMGDDFDGVPYIIIGDKTFNGYSSSSNDSIKSAIDDYYKNDNLEDIVLKVKEDNNFKVTETNSTVTTEATTSAKKKNADTYIAIAIIIIAIIGLGYVIYLSRKDVQKVKKVSAKKIEEKKEEPIAEKTETKKSQNASTTKTKTTNTNTSKKKNTSKNKKTTQKNKK